MLYRDQLMAIERRLRMASVLSDHEKIEEVRQSLGDLVLLLLDRHNACIEALRR